MAMKIGLVFSGGGGKGAYQIGVWKALNEFGVAEKVQVVAGTSVGALNALLFAQDNYALAEHFWLHIRQEDILKIDSRLLSEIFREAPVAVPPALCEKAFNFFRSRGLWSRAGLMRMLDAAIDAEALAVSPVKLFAACTDVTEIPSSLRPLTALTHYLFEQSLFQGEARYFAVNGCAAERIRRILLASSALPILFHAEELDGRVYYDGGLVDNIPIRPVYQEQCDLIFVVQVDALSVVSTERFPGADLIPILPQDSQGGFLDGTLDFSRDGAQRRIEQGYADAARIFGSVEFLQDVQRSVETNLQRMSADENEFQRRRSRLLQQRRNLKNELAPPRDGS